MADVRVRKAIDLAIDRVALSAALDEGNTKSIPGLLALFF